MMMASLGLLMVLPTLAAASPAAPKGQSITKAPYGRVDGRKVQIYTLTNANGLVLKVTNYGAIITEFHVPDRHGKSADIVHGFATVQEYMNGNPYFGAIVGRVANRIRGARFELEGRTYELAMNNPQFESHLHGGVKGFDKVVWTTIPRGFRRGSPSRPPCRNP